MRKMGGLVKGLALVLMLLMAVTLMPGKEAVAEDTAYGYLVIHNTTTNRVVNFRPRPGTSDYISRLPEGLVMEILDTTTYNKVLWYKVENLDSGRVGYIHGDFMEPMDAGEVALWQAAGTELYPSYVGPVSTPVPEGTVPPANTPLPTEAPDAGSLGQYVITTAGGVNVRKTPDGTCLTGPMSSKIPKGTILRWYDAPVKQNNKVNWQKVDFNGLIGYIHSDFFEYCDAYGNYLPGPTVVPEATATPKPTEFNPSTATQQGTVTTTSGGLNFRRTAGGKVMYRQDGRIYRIERNVTLPYFGYESEGGYKWYYVYDASTGTYGYLRHDFLIINSTVGPTEAPQQTGYVATSLSSVWLRDAPKTGANTCGKIVKAGTVVLQTGYPVQDSSYANRYWYPVIIGDGTRGYLRSDCVFELAQWQVDYYNQYGTCPTPTPGPATPRPGNSDYIITTAGDLWVREKPSKKAGVLFGNLQLDQDYVTKFYDTDEVSGVTWYKIQVNGSYGWVHGNFVRVLSNAEYDQWQGEQPTPTPKPTATPLPDPSTFSDLALTTADKVILRSNYSTSSKELTRVYYEGTQLTYLGQYKQDNSMEFYWFKVKYGTVTGWMHGDFVRVLTNEEKQMYQLAGDPDAPPEASYRNLSLGSTGEDVTALQEALVEKGYLDAAYVTGTYQSATEAAVRSFQKDSNISVDGVAGEQTQHALFGTVPEGTYTGSSVNPVLYPVEKSDWWTGDINSVWSVGKIAIITDVKTGISFRAQRLYGDNHADAEPATTDDTEAVCRIYGVSNPQEISDREQELQSYRRRPLWVTIGTRTFCGSMYGIPHNYEGDRIPDNGYNGQFCVHFTNSMTHGSDDNPAKIDYDSAKNGWYGHQSAIEDAYEQSISGWKDK